MKKLFLQCSIVVLLSLLYSCHKESVSPSNGGGQSSANAIIYTAVLNGIYERGVPLDTTNYIKLYLNVHATGPYAISTAQPNGYKFSASGNFTTTGSYTLKLMGSGTPTSEELDSVKIATTISVYNKIGVQVTSNVSNKIIFASGGSEFNNTWNTMAITGRGKLLWKIPGYTQFTSVNNGIVYFSDSHSLKALHVTTGDSVWSNAALKGMTNVSYADQVLYMSGPSIFEAVDATTGKVMWSYPSGYYVSNGAPIVGSSIVVFTNVGLYGLNKSTGTLAWSNMNVEPAGTPVISGNTLYAAGGYAKGTTAVDVTTGKVIWQNTTDTYGSLVFDNGKIYANGTNNVYCFDAATGNTLWTSANIGYLAKSPTISNGKIFVTTNFGFTSVYALDASTGKTLWSQGSSFGFANTELVASEGTLYLGTFGGSVDGYYLNTGQIVSYVLHDTPLAMDYQAVMAAYDSDTKQASYPSQNGEQ
jgi:outer membrane protein assembly factor BamB